MSLVWLKMLSLSLCGVVCVRRPTLLAVGATDLYGSQVVQQFLEVRVADDRPPGVVGTVVEPEHTHAQTHTS